MHPNFHIVPSFSLTPNKLVLYNRFYKAESQYTSTDKILEKIRLDNLKRQFHGFEISDNANRNLKNKINWLYYLAKKRSIITYSGKNIFNFKIAFITLTLPSVQKHPSSQITNELFNQFLTEVRQRTGMKNYVWRLEFQKNGNIHYHIVTDTYLDYHLALSIWNRILDKLGYVKAYSDKYQSMDFKKYFDINNSNNKADFDKIKARYIKGVKSKWKNPNTVDVKSVVSGRNIAGYIGKYFSKIAKTGKNCNSLDNEENSKNMRLWFCSRSLSKLSKISGSEEKAPFDIYSIVSKAVDLFELKAEYCTVFYFSIKSIFQSGAKKINKLLFDYASKTGYFDNLAIV